MSLEHNQVFYWGSVLDIAVVNLNRYQIDRLNCLLSSSFDLSHALKKRYISLEVAKDLAIQIFRQIEMKQASVLLYFKKSN